MKSQLDRIEQLLTRIADILDGEVVLVTQISPAVALEFAKRRKKGREQNEN